MFAVRVSGDLGGTNVFQKFVISHLLGVVNVCHVAKCILLNLIKASHGYEGKLTSPAMDP